MSKKRAHQATANTFERVDPRKERERFQAGSLLVFSFLFACAVIWFAFKYFYAARDYTQYRSDCAKIISSSQESGDPSGPCYNTRAYVTSKAVYSHGKSGPTFQYFALQVGLPSGIQATTRSDQGMDGVVIAQVWRGKAIRLETAQGWLDTYDNPQHNASLLRSHLLGAGISLLAQLVCLPFMFLVVRPSPGRWTVLPREGWKANTVAAVWIIAFLAGVLYLLTMHF